MSTGYKIFYGLCGCIVVALFVLIGDFRKGSAEYKASPEYAAEKALREAEKLRFARETEAHEATIAMRRSPTAENIARWEAAKRAVYGPQWKGSWQEDIAQDNAFWAQQHVERQGRQLQKDLRERPVVVVVESR